MIASAKTILAVSSLVMAMVGAAVTGGVLKVRAAARSTPVVIRAELVRRRVVYTVDSKPALPDLLRVLSVIRENRADRDVIALVDDEAPISEIGTIDGVAGKAGFPKVQFYVFNKDSRRMSTIEFGPDMPYSQNPPDQ